MKSRILSVVVVVVGLSFAANRVSAHHALQAEFDTAKRGEFTGTLTKFALINPHVRWFFDVQKGGAIEKWELVGAGPQALRDNGMTRIFKVGETGFSVLIARNSMLPVRARKLFATTSPDQK